jgi:hypothetical protein
MLIHSGGQANRSCHRSAKAKARRMMPRVIHGPLPIKRQFLGKPG